MSHDHDAVVKFPADRTANPLAVEVTRGGVVESIHRGSVAVVNLAGEVTLSCGDIRKPVYPRSAIKAFQALPLVETGGADAAGFTDEEIALTCASHNGEARHAETARRMLEKCGFSVDDLECGSHWPYHEESGRTLAVEGKTPCPLHNNCSGKHAGMLALAKHLGVDPKGYVKRTHAVQQRILGTIEAMCGVELDHAPCGIDGCSVPTWGVPLENLAYGFARFGAPDDLPPERADACRRIAKAVFANPFMVAGTGRFDTLFMETMAPRAFTKVGAEGVFCASLPDYGLGVALKCDDGAERAASVMIVAVLRHIGVVSDEDLKSVGKLLDVPLENRMGVKVGEIRVCDDFPH